MSNLNSCDHTDQLQPGNSPADLTQKSIKRIKPFLAFLFICLVFFLAPFQHSESRQLHRFTMDPEDMVQNGFYFFSDHGSGVEVAQFDRMEGNNVYTFSSIRPSTLTFRGPGLWGPSINTGDIRLATLGEITHLLACVLAGIYVP
jgi:hypothetical protein